ncbi:histidine kinase dimerization/phosphoacceptor domain -containing protein [Chitinispirillales bacterium ANBcel5]|uniref:histidine kinase dimerization/phosphoacceptor domain -containing protein n=1 Tax=Cellulosispirillum alkaliphilum TaxID=3039283 RepID=UPI002A51ECC8|nr:histidine kinase dimerization/phosphoacceptor domain -containing protein [Chitinispirillales bacterium ANBcel5]
MENQDLATHVHDPARLAALKAVALLDSPTEEAFDRLSRLATRFVHAPVSLVTLIDANRQYFKSCIGLPEPWQSSRETPLSHSFCQHNRIVGRPLVIEDARKHPIFKENPAIWDLRVIAYLGIPLVTSDGYVLGSFCVIDSKPRKWSDEDISIMQDLTAAVMTEIHLRTEIAARNKAEGERKECADTNNRLHSEIDARVSAEEKLKSTLIEKETLIQEIYHRTKNNMQVIANILELQAEFAGNAQVNRTIQESVSRINTMALAHEKLYTSKDLSRINLNEYIRNLVKQMLVTHKKSSEHIIVTFDIEEICALIDVAIPCGLIINELLSNTLNHAFPYELKGKIAIGVKRLDNKLWLTYFDNGVGLPKGTDILQQSRLGVKLIYQIVEHQLHGSIETETDHGLRWYIQFSPDVYQERV